jgi:hypothetical protein
VPEQDLQDETKVMPAFYDMLRNVSAGKRFRMLHGVYKDTPVPLCYRHLAVLIRAGYFNTVLTTNIDTYGEIRGDQTYPKGHACELKTQAGPSPPRRPLLPSDLLLLSFLLVLSPLPVSILMSTPLVENSSARLHQRFIADSSRIHRGFIGLCFSEATIHSKETTHEWSDGAKGGKNMNVGSESTAGTGAVGAALGVILVYVIELLAGIDIPLAVEGAITVVVTFLVGYLVPARIGRGPNGGPQ